MSKISSMMDIGRRSMQNSSSALQTVSHNIANKNTEGYSRQRVDFATNEPIGHGKTRVGMGARPGRVARINNSYIEKQLQKETNNLGFSEGKAEALGRVEQVYNEQVNKGLNRYMGEFFNSFRELSNNPESLSSRTLVKESADFLAKDFQRVDKQLTEIQNDVDYQVTQHVSEVNSITKEIANLNENVQLVTLQGGPANDERDRRDLLLKELGEKINIKYAESDDGLLTITGGSSAVLVSGFSHRELFVSSSGEKGNKQEGNVDVYYKPSNNATAVKVTEQIKGGKIGGLLEVRDGTINDLRNNLDTMAYTLSKEVNKAHVEGFDKYNNKGALFFNNLNDSKGAARLINVSETIKNNVGKVVAAATANAPGDNRVANIISSVQYKGVLDSGTTNLDDYYGTMVGDIGIWTNKANNEVKSQGDMVKQINNIRESVSGVSLDEETTKMIEYQKSFDASARLIRTADEMLDTVMNLKRY